MRRLLPKIRRELDGMEARQNLMALQVACLAPVITKPPPPKAFRVHTLSRRISDQLDPTTARCILHGISMSAD